MMGETQNFDRICLVKVGYFYDIYYYDAFVVQKTLGLKWVGNQAGPKKPHVGFNEQALPQHYGQEQASIRVGFDYQATCLPEPSGGRGGSRSETRSETLIYRGLMDADAVADPSETAQLGRTTRKRGRPLEDRARVGRRASHHHHQQRAQTSQVCDRIPVAEHGMPRRLSSVTM